MEPENICPEPGINEELNLNEVNKDWGNIRISRKESLAGKEYYTIIERCNGTQRNVTSLPVQWGKYTFSSADVVNLYRGNSVECNIEEENKIAHFFIASVGSRGMIFSTGDGFEGRYRMVLSTIYPCYHKEKGELNGYVCQKIYFPKKIFTMGDSYILNEKQVAALAYCGKMIDKKKDVFISINHFEQVKIGTQKEEGVRRVNFSVYQYGENISYKRTRQMERDPLK